jgi:hypothetical protein
MALAAPARGFANLPNLALAYRSQAAALKKGNAIWQERRTEAEQAEEEKGSEAWRSPRKTSSKNLDEPSTIR